MDIDNVVLSENQKFRLAIQMLKSKTFWELYAMQACTILLGYYVINTYKAFGESVPILDDDKYLTEINSISAIFNSVRFIWSGALDKLSFKKVYGCLILIQLLIAFTVRLAELSRVSFAVMFCMTLFCVGGHFALFPNVLK